MRNFQPHFAELKSFDLKSNQTERCSGPAEGAGRGRRQRPELKRLEPVPGVQTAAELRARVQDYPMDDDGSPRRRGSRMRPSESAPALGRFRAP